MFVLGNLCVYIAIKDILLKTIFLHYLADSIGLTATSLTC